MSNKRDDSTSQDPFEAWRSFLTEAERNINESLSKAMATPQYTAASQGVLKALLQSQNTFQKMTRRYLETVNLATRDDITAIAERLDAIEESLSRLEKSAAVAGKSRSASRSTAAKPKRTRSPSINTD
ncbi:hypothetical protein A6D6_03013 [Alcanivorax xiamenensis]|uniref:Poly(3-hydroxyalkanoate) polymerase subunit PhaE n=1 Tax=Alcanivorax xiamenensis TaxID=1177156 RepID=A0ABQ6Y5L0_9GAMM|nr:hypothetical protein [Alcanivorax xiamenensis]KAF0804551.1 hypothetical protein A6D6_03013 [Alcanivorax xiamenensis]